MFKITETILLILKGEPKSDLALPKKQTKKQDDSLWEGGWNLDQSKGISGVCICVCIRFDTRESKASDWLRRCLHVKHMNTSNKLS